MKPYLIAWVAALCLPFSALAESTSNPHSDEWWYEPYPKPFEAPQTDLSFIHVKGKRFVSDEGETVVFRGVNIADPDKLSKNGKWSRRHFEIIQDWGANIVRVPVHPFTRSPGANAVKMPISNCLTRR